MHESKLPNILKIKINIEAPFVQEYRYGLRQANK